MRVLWHMPTLQPSSCGLSRRAFGFADGLQHAGHSVAFLVAQDKTSFEYGECAGQPQIHVTPVNRSVPRHWSLQSRCRLSDAEQILQQANGTVDLFISCQPEAIAIAKSMWPSIPRLFVCGGVTILHDGADAQRRDGASIATRLAFQLDRTLKRRNERTAFQSADAVVFDSQSTRRRVIAEYRVDPAKGHAIYAAIDSEQFRPPSESERATSRQRFGLSESDFCLAWTGRLSPEKNLSVLIDAMAKLPSDAKLLLVGDGPTERDIRTQVSNASLSERVLQTGAMPDVRPALWAADAFVFPSISESLGLSLIEAMSAGLPCIALQADERNIRNASAEILDAGHCGVLVKANTAEAFADAIQSLRVDTERRAKFAQAARARAAAEFAWAGGQSRFNDLVERLACRFIGTGKRVQRTTLPILGS